jgi:type I restriction enzyme R subunit
LLDFGLNGKSQNLDNLEPPEVTRPEKIKIKLADGKEREIIHSIKTSFWSPEGKPLSQGKRI